MNSEEVVTGIRALLVDGSTSPTFGTKNAVGGAHVPTEVYDLSGRRVAPSELSGNSSQVPRFLIVNGKKVVR